MSVETDSEEARIIRQLIPFSTISSDQFKTLCQKITVEEAEQDTFLFKRNDVDDTLVYLITGSIRLQSEDLIVEDINSDSQSAKFALAHQIPRKIDALTLSNVRYLRLEHNILETLPSSHQPEENIFMSIDEPEESQNDDDWMTTLLKSPIFSALPPANLQQLVMSLDEVKFAKGEIIIKQGDPGDYYYLIKKGYCLISRRASENAKEIKLAQLRSQDTFGEDSLISGEPRNVTVTALTKVSLIRLDKEKFISLVKEPSLKYVSHAELLDLLTDGAVLIDVSSPDQFKLHKLPNSINIPFFSLRLQLNTLDKSKPVIVSCENSKTSEAAAFLLLRNNIHALILEGGIPSLSTESAEPAEAEFQIDDGVETLAAPALETVNPDEQTAQEDSSSETSHTVLQENQQLKQEIEILRAEKAELEKKYRMLFKQTEKLKSILDTVKKGKT